MSDDKIVTLPVVRVERVQEGGYPTADYDPVDLPPAVAIPSMDIGALGFEDMTAAFNMRDWLQDACEAKGAKIVGGGFGMGAADLDVELDGCRFSITIRAI